MKTRRDEAGRGNVRMLGCQEGCRPPPTADARRGGLPSTTAAGHRRPLRYRHRLATLIRWPDEPQQRRPTLAPPSCLPPPGTPPPLAPPDGRGSNDQKLLLEVILRPTVGCPRPLPMPRAMHRHSTPDPPATGREKGGCSRAGCCAPSTRRDAVGWSLPLGVEVGCGPSGDSCQLTVRLVPGDT